MIALSRLQRDPRDLKAGDIIGFSGDSWLSASINLATYGLPWWSLSHVGIVADYDGELLLFESTTLNDVPCVIQGRPFRGTQAQRPIARIGGYKGKVWHYSLYRPLYPDEDMRLTKLLVSTVGTPYDEIGALRAGGIGWSWIESLLREQDLSSIFCSEWVAAAYAAIGLFATDNVSRWNPNRLVRYLRHHEILLKPRRLK